MDWAVVEIKEKSLFPPSQQPYPYPYFVHFPPPPHSQSNGFINVTNKVSPGVLLAITILSVIFFIYGAVHLLARMLLRPPARDSDEPGNLTALEGQLQQLFHLHDAGVDQSLIDTLPVFDYKSIIGGGVKDPFDCAVCLCEFQAEDELRLLPKCSHAFHVECIDSWLLSHSTCPLCRASLGGDLSLDRRCSPFVLVLESRGGSSREIGISEIEAREEEGVKWNVGFGENKVVSVKLGKFKNLDENCGECSSANTSSIDARRCFSMGSFAYVMDEKSSLQVPIRTATPRNRAAISECGCDSRREFFNGFEAFKILETDHHENSCSIGGIKKESFSVSKIWLREKRDAAAAATMMGSSRRAFSLRLPVPVVAAGEELIAKNGGIVGSETQGSENATACFARKTLVWIMGIKANKAAAVHSSVSTNV